MHRWSAPLAMLLLAAPALAVDRAHPHAGPNPAADACESCHAKATPTVTAQWEAGKHGLLLVKCFVCHGSTGKDFVARPNAARCEGCHPAQVASVVPVKAAPRPRSEPRTAAADCFSCHAPHSLEAAQGAANPHSAR